MKEEIREGFEEEESNGVGGGFGFAENIFASSSSSSFSLLRVFFPTPPPFSSSPWPPRRRFSFSSQSLHPYNPNPPIFFPQIHPTHLKSMELREQQNHLNLDLALSIGGTFSNLPGKSNGSDEESGLTDVKNRGEIRRRQGKRKREEDRNNPPWKEEKKLEGDLMNNVDLHKPDPALQIPYPSSSLQYVPFLNGYGYAFPCFVPYWATAGESLVGCRSVSDVGFSNKKSGSCGSSPVCSSSIISDNHQSSSSHEGTFQFPSNPNA